MSKERELFEKVFETWQFWHPALDPEAEPLFRDIRAFLDAEPKAKPARKPIPEEEIENIYYSGLIFEDTYLAAFVEGFRQSEKHHGIGGKE